MLDSDTNSLDTPAIENDASWTDTLTNPWVIATSAVAATLGAYFLGKRAERKASMTPIDSTLVEAAEETATATQERKDPKKSKKDGAIGGKTVE